MTVIQIDAAFNIEGRGLVLTADQGRNPHVDFNTLKKGQLIIVAYEYYRIREIESFRNGVTGGIGKLIGLLVTKMIEPAKNFRMDYALIGAAITLSEETHHGIFRKYFEPRVPYAVHPRQVAKRAARLDLPHPLLSIVIAVAYLHDTLEDKRADGTYLSPAELEAHTNSYVLEGTLELTNPSKGSTEPRAVRKQMDRDHIAQISDTGKLLKLIDRTVNLGDLIGAPRDFRALYLNESWLLFQAIGQVNHPDYDELADEFVLALQAVKSTL